MPSQQVTEKLEKLQKELDTASSAIKHIDGAAKVVATVSDIYKRLPELINELKAVEEKHRKELVNDHKEKIGVLEKQLQSLLNQLNEKSQHLNQVIAETKSLQAIIVEYFTKIKKINFPDRLNNIENQIEITNTTIPYVESNLLAETKKLESKLFAENEFLRKLIKSTRVITIVFGIIITIAVVVSILIHFK